MLSSPWHSTAQGYRHLLRTSTTSPWKQTARNPLRCDVLALIIVVGEKNGVRMKHSGRAALHAFSNLLFEQWCASVRLYLLDYSLACIEILGHTYIILSAEHKRLAMHRSLAIPGRAGSTTWRCVHTVGARVILETQHFCVVHSQRNFIRPECCKLECRNHVQVLGLPRHIARQLRK